MARLFGTDGVRGVANVDLTCELSYRLGQAAASFMGKTIVVGKDTRKSGDMLEAAVVAGITSAGGDALLTGVIPTPAVALLVRELHADGGIVISASHNPPEYNGIKFFDANGFKLPDAVEDEIEKFIAEGGVEGQIARAKEAGEEAEMPVGDEVGVALEVEDACEMYINHAVETVTSQGINFDGLHVALDTGHGASSLTSAEALRRLGAEVTVINDDYDGTEIDGDIVEAVLAVDLKNRGELPHNTAVSTVMTNLGFVRAMEAHGIDVLQTKVGDRYVLEAMREGGYAVGGEQSGHMILLEHNSTGDGLVTACQFLAAVRRSGKPVEEAIKVMTKFPQTLINVRVKDKHALEGNAPIWDAVHAAEAEMGDTGRVLVRTSGTEPLVRVMVEAETQESADAHAKAIAGVVERELA